MNVTEPTPAAIAAAYGCTRQRIYELKRKYGLTIPDLLEPLLVLERLLYFGNASKLRSNLCDPSFRQSITSKLNS